MPLTGEFAHGRCIYRVVIRVEHFLVAGRKTDEEQASAPLQRNQYNFHVCRTLTRARRGKKPNGCLLCSVCCCARFESKQAMAVVFVATVHDFRHDNVSPLAFLLAPLYHLSTTEFRFSCVGNPLPSGWLYIREDY